MPESEKSNSPKSSDNPGGQQKAPHAKSAKNAAAGSSKSLSARVERSLKDVDRLLKKNPDAPPHERAMAQLEQAKVSALLHLAEAIRETRKADGRPQA